MRADTARHGGLGLGLLGVGAYCGAHFLLRVATSDNLGENDPVVAVRVEIFGFASSIQQPPLFEWLAAAILATSIDPSAAFQILRYGLLAAALVASYLVARRVTGSAIWALLTVEGYALIYQLSWRGHEGFTYPLTAMLTVALLWLQLVRMIEARRTGDGALLGAIIGLGLLSTYWFHMALLAAIGASAFSPQLRAVWTSRSMVSAAGVAALMAAPFWAWQLQAEPLADLLGRIAPTTPNLDPLGVVHAALILPALAMSPLAPLLALLFPAGMFARRLATGDPRTDAIGAGLLASLLLLALLALFWGGVSYSEHSILPLLWLAPVWLADRARRGGSGQNRRRAFLWIGIAIALVALVARAANLIVYEPVCNKCYFAWPYERLIETVRSDPAFAPVDGVMAYDVRDAGQIAAHWPEALVLHPTAGARAVAEIAAADALLMMWRDGPNDAQIAAWIRDSLGVDHAQAGAAVARAVALEIGWRHAFRPDGYRATTWHAVRVERPARRRVRQ